LLLIDIEHLHSTSCRQQLRGAENSPWLIRTVFKWEKNIQDRVLGKREAIPSRKATT